MSARTTMGGKWGVLATSCMLILIIALNTTAINTAVNSIADDLDLTSSSLTWAINIYLLAVAAIVAVTGRLGDIIGVRRLILIGLAIFAVGSVLTAISDSGAMLIGGRACQGFGSAFLMPGSMQALQQAFPEEERSTALGAWGAVAGIGFAIGPLFGGIWTDAVSWRGIFWSDLPMLAIALVLALATLGGLPAPKKHKPIDLVGAAVLAVAVFLLVFGLQRSEFWGFDSADFWVTMGVSAALFGVFAFIETKRRSPLVHLRLFRIPPYVGSMVATFASTAALIGMLYFFNLFVQSPVTLDESAVAASIALLPYGVMMFVFSLWSGRVASRVGFAIPVGGGLAVSAIGFVWFAAVAGDLSSGALWAPITLSGIGVGLTFSTAGAGGLAAVPQDSTGEAAGAINVARYVGGALGLAVGSALYNSRALDRFNESLTEQGITGAERGDLDNALTGSASGLESAINDLGSPPADSVASAAADALVAGIEASMVFLAAVALIGAIIVAVTMRRHRGGAAA
ncbi:MAG: MFS transporter [Miltoncostaeaceae bacterium]